MSECIHGLEPVSCSLCQKPPLGVNERVWITWGGSVFHNYPDCSALEEGQEKARGDGLLNHEKKQVSWNTVMIERRACRTCCGPTRFR